jgi:hypothetical protein
MDRTMTMTDADRPDRLALDEHEFALTSAVLTVTRLPWGELSLDLEARGDQDHDYVRHCVPRLEEVRAPGTGRLDLDGLVIETAQGWYPDPDTPNAIIATHNVYYGEHDELYANRVELRRIDDNHVRVLWTGTTRQRRNRQTKLDSKLTVDVRATVKDGEYERLRIAWSEGLDQAEADGIDAAREAIWSWRQVRGRELDAAGYFGGRSFARVEFVLVYRAILREPRIEMRTDHTLRVTVDVPIAVVRTRPAELADVIKATMNAALDEVARAYPAAPSYLR